MTKDELVALPPEKVNELAATEIMKRHISPEGRYYWWENASDGHMCRQAVNEWNPMSSIADAWLLLEEMLDNPEGFTLEHSPWSHKDKRWKLSIYLTDEKVCAVCAAIAPAAITLACVAAAMEVE